MAKQNYNARIADNLGMKTNDYPAFIESPAFLAAAISEMGRHGYRVYQDKEVTDNYILTRENVEENVTILSVNQQEAIGCAFAVFLEEKESDPEIIFDPERIRIRERILSIMFDGRGIPPAQNPGITQGTGTPYGLRPQQAMVPPAKSEIQTMLDDLSQKAGRVNDKVQALRERLQPVSVAAGPMANAASPSRTTCAVGGQMESIWDCLDSVQAALEDIDNRLRI